MLLEEIEKLGYHITKHPSLRASCPRMNFLMITKPDGTETKIPMTMERPVKIGGKIETTVEALYRAFYAPDASDGDWAFFKSNYPDRDIWDMVMAAKEKHGIIGSDGEADTVRTDFIPDTVREIRIKFNPTVKFGQLIDGRWCAEYTPSCDLDSFYSRWVFFKNDLSDAAFVKAFRVAEIDRKIEIGYYSEFELREYGILKSAMDCSDEDAQEMLRKKVKYITYDGDVAKTYMLEYNTEKYTEHELEEMCKAWEKEREGGAHYFVGAHYYLAED